MAGRCLNGEVCQAVGELAQTVAATLGRFDTFMQSTRDAQSAHTNESLRFWEEQKSKWLLQHREMRGLLDEIKEVPIRLNDGHHIMQGIQTDLNAVVEKQRDDKKELQTDLKKHETGEYGAHAATGKTLNVHFWWLVALSVICLATAGFVATAHRGFFDYLRETIFNLF